MLQYDQVNKKRKRDKHRQRERKREHRECAAICLIWFHSLLFIYCCCLSFVDVKISWETLTPSTFPHSACPPCAPTPLCAGIWIRRMTQIDCSFCSRFQLQLQHKQQLSRQLTTSNALTATVPRLLLLLPASYASPSSPLLLLLHLFLRLLLPSLASISCHIWSAIANVYDDCD